MVIAVLEENLAKAVWFSNTLYGSQHFMVTWDEREIQFKDHAKKIAISSTKSVTGHCLGAAGGIEGVLLANSIYNQIAPPTANYEADPKLELDYVPNEARDLNIEVGISNSFGFGGTNSSLVMKKFEK